MDFVVVLFLKKFLALHCIVTTNGSNRKKPLPPLIGTLIFTIIILIAVIPSHLAAALTSLSTHIIQANSSPLAKLTIVIAVALHHLAAIQVTQGVPDHNEVLGE